jgi:hypothetical protein
VRAPELSLIASTLALALLTTPGRAAADPAQPDEPPAVTRPASGPYLHMFGALALGRGIRFNNPYRLATPLGDDAESLSLTATYFDGSVSATFGDPDGFQHGGSVHLSIALDGVRQEVATPSYVLLHRLGPSAMAYARAGLPLVMGPDVNLGYELALGGAWLFTGGIGATAELVGDLYYGAATQERAASAIPVLSLQLGVLVDYEVLP